MGKTTMMTRQATRLRPAATDEYPDATPTEKIMTAREVAKLLRVNVKTVYDAFAAGDLPGMRIGTRLRFHRDEVLELLRQERVVPNRKGRR